MGSLSHANMQPRGFSIKEGEKSQHKDTQPRYTVVYSVVYNQNQYFVPLIILRISISSSDLSPSIISYLTDQGGSYYTPKNTVKL